MCNMLLFLVGALVILILLHYAMQEGFYANGTSRTSSVRNYYTAPRSVSSLSAATKSDISGGVTGGGRSGGRDSAAPSGSSGRAVSDTRGRRYMQQIDDDDDAYFNEAQNKCLEQYQDCLAGNRFDGKPDEYDDFAEDAW